MWIGTNGKIIKSQLTYELGRFKDLSRKVCKMLHLRLYKSLLKLEKVEGLPRGDNKADSLKFDLSVEYN